MKPFLVPNENFVKSEITEIAVATTAGTPVAVTVDNNNGFDINDYAIVGTEGEEKAELRRVTATPFGVISFVTLVFDHKKGEKITRIAFNQRKFYGCATVSGPYVLIETKDIEVDNPRGTYFEYIGTAYSYFKATYYNSTTTTESAIANAVASKADDTDHYCSVFDIREEAGFEENPYISDGRIHTLRLMAESEVKGYLAGGYTLPLSEVPEIVRIATKLIAAGWLLWQEFGIDPEDAGRDGRAKIEEGRNILKGISENKIILMDSSDNIMAKADTGIAGFPDETTKDLSEEDSGGDIKFRISKEF